MSVSEEHTSGVTIKLSNATLPDLPAKVARPKYDRSKGVVRQSQTPLKTSRSYKKSSTFQKFFV